MAVKLAMLTCVAAAAMAHGVAGLRFHTSAVVSPIVRKSVALGGQRGRSNVPAMLMPEVAAALAAAGTDSASAVASTGLPLHLVGDAISAVSAADVPVRLTDEAIKAAAGELGWWGSYVKFVEDGIFALHDALAQRGLPAPYGTAIFVFVVGVKLLTLPLNYNQLASAGSLKQLQPQQELVRKWYGDNKNILNQEVGLLFESQQVNPLAGCLPALAQIPIFLGVYYSVTSIAKAKIFNEGFLWIPNLSGPIADRTEGLSWLTENWANGAPPLGWADTLCYLSIPCILIVTQSVSLKLLGSFEALGENNDNKTAALALRLLPLMLGWFALNAPSGLGLYWVFNNILTTAQTVVIKKVTEKPPLELAGVDDIVLAIGERRSVRADAGVVALDWARPPPKTTAAAATDAAATDAAIESAPAEHNEAQPKA